MNNNKQKKIILVFGTRPEAIKMAPLVHALKINDSFDVITCVTGQHREMLDQVLKIFKISPNIDLNLMKHKQDLFDLTSSLLLNMKQVLNTTQPELVLVHGDTTTALATAMASFYCRIPVGHVEAGLRTNDMNAPFPEEFNRQTISKIAKWHFAPTELSKSNLVNENVSRKAITVSGNTVIDALFWVLKQIENDKSKLKKITNLIDGILRFDWRNENYVLITGHRRENFGDGFLEICQGIRKSAMKYNHNHFVYPVHLNPNVQGPVRKMLDGIDNVHLIEPLDYEPFVYLLKHCYFVLTDSGGIQEEGPSLGKPVLVMRNKTERPEAVSAGTVKLVGAKKDEIFSSISKLFDKEEYYNKMSLAHNPYGDGNACSRIIKKLSII